MCVKFANLDKAKIIIIVKNVTVSLLYGINEKSQNAKTLKHCGNLPWVVGRSLLKMAIGNINSKLEHQIIAIIL